MSEELLQGIVKVFNPEKFIRFFREKNRSFAPRTEDLSQYGDENFRNGIKLGEIKFAQDEKMLICAFEAAQPLSERSGKKAQYEKGKRILKENQSDAGIFIFYNPQGNFRFSLIYANYLGKKRDWSAFRRFTYFVSPSETNETFLRQIGEEDFSSLDKIKDAFSVEKVTKEFYAEIAYWYFWAVQNVQFPEDAEEENGKNIAVIRLITRMIFIWFMKERGLIQHNLFKYKNISVLLKDLSPENTTYYKAILQNLFFATLNTKIGDRKFRFGKSFQGKNKDYMDHSIYRYEDYFKDKEDMLEIFKDIPFPNGGLFDCLDRRITENGKNIEIRIDGFTDKEVGLKAPNKLFFSDEINVDLNKDYGTTNKKYKIRGLIDILSSYNFTIDENEPNDADVALDPELLGKVFENLLASFNPETASTARKATGSYYTPREIVDYMVTQSLREYFKTHLKEVDDIDNKLDLLFAHDSETNPFSKPDTLRMVALIDNLRIVDPAVGSGAFPMGVLNKLVLILAKLDPENALWKETQINAVEDVTDPILRQKLKKQIEEQFAEKNFDYGRKLYLIQKCIYGVDIQQIAVEIAKLRFFIALLVDEKIDKSKPNWGIEPLPNLDFKLMQGNSLISEFMGINLDVDGDDKKPDSLFVHEEDMLITQFQNKKNEYQNEPDRDKKEKLKDEIEGIIVKIFETKLKRQKADYFNQLQAIERKYSALPNEKQRQELIATEKETLYNKSGFNLESAEKQLCEFTSGLKVKPFFAWKLYFAEVFNKENPGFDIVIANPPYVGHKGGIKKFFKEVRSSSLGKRFNNERMDLFYYFFHISLDISKEYGNISFITTNYYLTADSAIKLRNDFRERAVILELVNFHELKIFDSAQGQHSILTFLQKGIDEDSACSTCLTHRVGLASQEILKNVLDGNDEHTVYGKVSQKELYDGHNNYIRIISTHNEKQVIVNEILIKITSQGTSLSILCNISQGIVSGIDKISQKHIRKVSSLRKLLGSGVYVLNNNEKVDIGRSSLIKPWFKNSDIQKYYVNEKNNQWLIHTHSELDLDNYPNIKKHLQKYQSIIECRNYDSGELSKAKRLKAWWALSSSRKEFDFAQPKIISPQRSNSNIFAYTEKEWFASADVYFITSKTKECSLKYILALLNSKLYYLWLYQKGKRKGEMLELYLTPLSEIPIKKVSEKDQKPFIEIVDEILAITKSSDYLENPAKKEEVKEYEKQIDQMVYKLYGLTPEEIEIVEVKK